VSGYPLIVEGSMLKTVIVGGGRVAARKARGLLDAGASVDVVTLTVSPELEALSSSFPERLRINCARYQPVHLLPGAALVIAATDDHETNVMIARDAKARGMLVNVASDPETGNCITPAVHRSGDLVVAVSAGGVPRAAVRIRNAIAERFDRRFAHAIKRLAGLRRTLLDGGDSAHWREASAALIDESFCERVESNRFDLGADEWR
jgi:siroheme synthase-like protein